MLYLGTRTLLCIENIRAISALPITKNKSEGEIFGSPSPVYKYHNSDNFY